MEEKLQVTNDLVFQRIFGKVGNEKITKGFIEKVLGIEIESLTLDTNKRLIGEAVENKIGRIDVKAKLKDKTKVVIEMQVVPFTEMIKRILYYWAETYTADLKKGDQYAELNKTIVILVSAKNLEETTGTKKYHTKWNIREEECTDIILSNDLEIHIIELDKFNEGEDRPEDNWIEFIKKGEVTKMKITDESIEEARKELIYLSSDPQFREEYKSRIDGLRDFISFATESKEQGLKEGMEQGLKEGKERGLKEGREQGIIEGREKGIKEGREEGRKQGIEQGIREGIEQGIEQGVKQKQKEVILNMYKKKMNIEDIAEIVNLKTEEVERIINESNTTDKGKIEK